MSSVSLLLGGGVSKASLGVETCFLSSIQWKIPLLLSLCKVEVLLPNPDQDVLVFVDANLGANLC